MIEKVEYEGREYSRFDVTDWSREQMRPLARKVAMERGDVNRTLLWNAAASVQRDYVFGGVTDGLVLGNGQPPVPASQPEPEAKVTSEPVGNGQVGSDALMDLIAKGLEGRIKASISEEMIEDLVKKHLKARESVTRVVLEGNGDQPDRDLGVQHKRFPLLLKLVGIKAKGKRHNIALVGPAGTGKTHSAHEVAKALGLPFKAISVGPQTTASQLMGYMDANGQYVSTALREAFENGGVICLDEFDASHAGVATIINALTANSHAGFPDGKLVARHADFIVIICMNTYGNGADAVYVGRNQLDGATMSRFATVAWDQDDGLELALAGNDDWCLYVQKVRKAIEALQVRFVVSPRASYDGAEALAAGVSRMDAEELYLWKGLKSTERSKVIAKMGELS